MDQRIEELRRKIAAGDKTPEHYLLMYNLLNRLSQDGDLTLEGLADQIAISVKNLKIVRRNICAYRSVYNHPCDCKYGVKDNRENTRRGSNFGVGEATGCCELYGVINLLNIFSGMLGSPQHKDFTYEITWNLASGGGIKEVFSYLDPLGPALLREAFCEILNKHRPDFVVIERDRLLDNAYYSIFRDKEFQTASGHDLIAPGNKYHVETT